MDAREAALLAEVSPSFLAPLVLTLGCFSSRLFRPFSFSYAIDLRSLDRKRFVFVQQHAFNRHACIRFAIIESRTSMQIAYKSHDFSFLFACFNFRYRQFEIFLQYRVFYIKHLFP